MGGFVTTVRITHEPDPEMAMARILKPRQGGTLLFVSLVLAAFLPVPAQGQLALDAATPPVAKKVPKEMTLHGDTRVDNYFWLREKSSPEVISYLKSENAYTDAVMKPTQGFQEGLYKEILGRIKQTDL